MLKKINAVFKKIIHNREAKNASWIIFEQVFQMVVSFVVGILSARYLGPSNYGDLNYTASFVTFFTSIASLGLDGVLIKKLINNPESEGKYLGGCMLLRAISSTLSCFAITCLVYILNPNSPVTVILAALQSLRLIFQTINILDCWFQRYLKSKYISIAKMIACIIVSSYRIYLLVTQKSIIWFAFSNSLTALVIAIVLLIVYFHEKSPEIKFDFQKGLDVLGESYHFILSGLMVAIYSQIDKIMLGGMMTKTDVGFYTTATTLSTMWIFFPTAIINSFRPGIMELKSKGKENAYLRRLEQLYSGIIWLCIAVSFIVFLFGDLAISILYGADYMPASAPLKVFIWSEAFSMIGSARGIWVVCENKNKYVKYYLGIGAVVNVILNYLMIPVWGTVGAAAATLITQITTAVIAPLLFKETRVHTKYVWESFAFKWYFGNNR